MQKIELKGIQLNSALEQEKKDKLPEIKSPADILKFENQIKDFTKIKLTHYLADDIYVISYEGKDLAYVKGTDNFNNILSYINTQKKVEISYILEKQQAQIITQNKLNTHKKQVIENLPSQNIESIIKLYKESKEQAFREDILSFLKEKFLKLNFKQKLDLLKQLSTEKNDLYYYFIIETIKSAKSNQVNEFLSVVSHIDIQKAITDYIIINDKFAEDFWYYYNSSRFSVSCKDGTPEDVCKKVGAYVWTLTINNKESDVNAIAEIIIESFGDKLENFANKITEGIEKYKKLKGKLPDYQKKILAERGLFGLLENILDKTNMTDEQKQIWLSIGQVGVLIGAVWGVIKFIWENGLKGLAGLIGAEFATEAATGKSLLTIASGILYGGVDLDSSSKKNTKIALDLKNKGNNIVDAIGAPVFINSIAGNRNLGDFSSFVKFENNSIKFDAKKYIDSLSDNDWVKALLKQIGEKKVAKIFESAFVKLGITTEQEFNKFKDKKVAELVNKYLTDVKKKTASGSSNLNTSNNSINSSNNKPKTSSTNTTTSSKVSSGASVVKDTSDNEGGNKVKQIPTIDEDLKIMEKERLNNLINYFNISNNEVKKLQEYQKLFNFDLVNFLQQYKDYIETNLSGFKYNDKIKKLIKINLLKLEDIIQERIDFVDKEIEEGDINPQDREKEIKNQRWIIAHYLEDYFHFINYQLLPNAILLHTKKQKDLPNGVYESIKKMFEAKVTEDGELDRDGNNASWYEIYDRITNSWDVPDFSDDTTKYVYGLKNLPENINILSKKDLEIEEQARDYYIGYVIFSLIPYLGATASIPADVVDTFSDQEGVITILKKLGFVNENYEMEKSYWDNIFGAIGIILSIFGLQVLVKAKKIKNVTRFRELDWESIKEAFLDIVSKKGGDKGYFSQKFDEILEKLGFSKGQKGEKILHGASSTPVEYYKNPKTGKTYTRTLDGKWYNSKGEELKRKPRNIIKVDKFSLESKLEEINTKIKDIGSNKMDLTRQIEKLKQKKENSPIIGAEEYYDDKIKILQLKLDKVNKELQKLNEEKRYIEDLKQKVFHNFRQVLREDPQTALGSEDIISDLTTGNNINYISKSVKKILKEIEKGETYDLGDGIKIGKGENWKYFVDNNGVVTNSMSRKELEQYLKENNLKNRLLISKLERNIVDDKIPSKIFEDTKFADTDLYLSKTDLNFNGKIYKLAKSQDGKYYVIEKGEAEFLKVKNKKLLEDFIEENPDFINTLAEKIDIIFVYKLFSKFDALKIPEKIRLKLIDKFSNIKLIPSSWLSKLPNSVKQKLDSLYKVMKDSLGKGKSFSKWLLVGDKDSFGKNFKGAIFGVILTQVWEYGQNPEDYMKDLLDFNLEDDWTDALEIIGNFAVFRWVGFIRGLIYAYLFNQIPLEDLEKALVGLTDYFSNSDEQTNGYGD